MVKRLYLGYSDGASSNLALGTKIATMEKEKGIIKINAESLNRKKGNL